jgi:hypothetical protein
MSSNDKEKSVCHCMNADVQMRFTACFACLTFLYIVLLT